MSKNLFKILKDDYFLQYPEDYQNSSDPEFRKLAEKINQLRRELVDRYNGRDLDLAIEDLERLYIAEQSPEKTLPYLAQMVGYDYDKSKTLRQLRQDVFKQTYKNKRTGTVSFLRDSIKELTSVEPTFKLSTGVVTTGWDQNSSIDGTPEAADFLGGVGWDQTNVFVENGQLQDFKWFVKVDTTFIDIKNDGVFDLDPVKNQKILNKVYEVIARYKDAGVIISVGYIDSVTAITTTMKYIFSTDVISNTESLSSGIIDNKDNGIEF